MTEAVEGGDHRQQKAQEAYRRRLLEIRGAFEAGVEREQAGQAAIRGRSDAMDALVGSLWEVEIKRDERLVSRAAVIAVGGYGRGELFPGSDVDLLFLLDTKMPEQEAKEAIRRVSQQVWDARARAAPLTRTLAECERFDPENVEATLALLDARLVCGSSTLFGRLRAAVAKLVSRDRRAVMAKLAELMRARYARYGGTLFHLEPNVKDTPGGLRDAHLCGWMQRLQRGREEDACGAEEEFAEAFSFLATVRCFLHYRRERDDNTLDWEAQDDAAERGVGVIGQSDAMALMTANGDASYWMRIYFRHARVVSRRALQAVSEIPVPLGMLPRLRRSNATMRSGFQLEHGRATLDAAKPGVGAGAWGDPAAEPHVVLGLFSEMARLGFVLARETEDRLSLALGALSNHLLGWRELWRELQPVLTGPFAGDALRAMHALGVLELLIPEFHGIDALVVRDAYHRYTVDEHTFVLIDTLQGLKRPHQAETTEWTAAFRRMMVDLPHPELLLLAALLHDTGKGRSKGLHAVESERMAREVAERLELNTRETELVTGLVRHHLEMSAALRRDLFDAETVRGFAAMVGTTEALRMLTLFTYADINAVHPDALTPWKAENLWRLYMATANALDRTVDEDRIGVGGELVRRVVELAPKRGREVEEYLKGFPERYLRTRTREQIRTHFEMASSFALEAVQLDFHYGAETSEITLVTRDREMLFATVAGVLAAWGMNVVTAEAFSNERGVVVDTFRFTDNFRTLEMNETERAAFVTCVRDVVAGRQAVEKLLASRRRGRRKAPKVKVITQVEFDERASSHSTLVQVMAQDTPGLLRALSLTLGRRGYNIEVALVDTEGELAIDVFYLTRNGQKLEAEERERLKADLLGAIEQNARTSRADT